MRLLEELEQLLEADERCWQGLELDDVTPIGLQVVRAEILATVRAIERLQRKFALSSAAHLSPLDGWQLSLREADPVTAPTPGHGRGRGSWA